MFDWKFIYSIIISNYIKKFIRDTISIIILKTSNNFLLIIYYYYI